MTDQVTPAAGGRKWYDATVDKWVLLGCGTVCFVLMWAIFWCKFWIWYDIRKQRLKQAQQPQLNGGDLTPTYRQPDTTFRFEEQVQIKRSPPPPPRRGIGSTLRRVLLATSSPSSSTSSSPSSSPPPSPPPVFVYTLAPPVKSVLKKQLKKTRRGTHARHVHFPPEVHSVIPIFDYHDSTDAAAEECGECGECGECVIVFDCGSCQAHVEEIGREPIAGNDLSGQMGWAAELLPL
uniref:Protein ORF92B n=1 Tax=Anguillid herpesvirus 1 TaxID=150286 RepID=A0A8E5EW47_9VIRU|nr:protein ORF92B [Anguillid herpesvirus 1]